MDKDKYNIFHLYKWTTILYEMVVVYEFIIVPLFWTIIFPGYVASERRARNGDLPDVDDFDRAQEEMRLGYIIVAGILDHSIPLIVLMIDFSYNCIPFLWRHFLCTLGVAIGYAIFNIIYSLHIDLIYPILDYRTPFGALFPALGLLWTFLMYYMLVFFSQKKLKMQKKNLALA